MSASPFAADQHPRSLSREINEFFALDKEEGEESTPITRVVEGDGEKKKASPVDQVGRDAVYGWGLGFLLAGILCVAWWLLVDVNRRY